MFRLQEIDWTRNNIDGNRSTLLYGLPTIYVITKKIFYKNCKIDNRYTEYRKFIANLIHKIDNLECRIYVMKMFILNGDKIKNFIDQSNDYIKNSQEIVKFIKEKKIKYNSLSLFINKIHNYENSLVDRIKNFI